MAFCDSLIWIFFLGGDQESYLRLSLHTEYECLLLRLLSDTLLPRVRQNSLTVTLYSVRDKGLSVLAGGETRFTERSAGEPASYHCQNTTQAFWF